MTEPPLPDPHLEIERIADQGEAWRWSIYDGENGPLIQRSEQRYPSPDAARRVGDKAVLAIQVRTMPSIDDPERS